MDEKEVLRKHFSTLGKKGAKARVKKYGKRVYSEMSRKRWPKKPPELSPS